MTDVSAKNPAVAPYGAWSSPISASLLTQSAIGLGNPEWHSGSIFWLEQRPSEGGRTVLVRQDSHDQTDLVPAGFNIRSRVHEYGGRAHVLADAAFYFVNFADQELYQGYYDDRSPRPCSLTSPWRYAELVPDLSRQRIVAVGEYHHDSGEPTNALVGVTLGDTAEKTQVLHSEADFYAYPTFNASMDRLAWITWSHPNMPWDGTNLWTAQVHGDGTLWDIQHVAGSNNESVLHPVWCDDGSLYFASDRSGYWNLYRVMGDETQAVLPKEADFAGPLWQLGERFFTLLENGDIVCRFVEQGRSRVGNISGGELTLLPTQFASSSVPVPLPNSKNGDWLLRIGSHTEPDRIVILTKEGRVRDEICRASTLSIPADAISAPQSIWFPNDREQMVHAFFYPPKSASQTVPPGTLPPLVVRSHGGPTGATGESLSLAIQYWTSRGIAVVDVNYGGSTGFGRDYRRRLDGLWGVVDVADCIAAARYLVAEGLVDPERLGIRGGSAGGYTTLSALTFADLFKAGASHYGIGDLMALAQDTHKFESRYLDRLIGPLPETAALYQERSPLHHAEKLNCPVIFFQGEDDKVVPPNQAETMVKSLRDQKIPVAYLCFPGEGHGFRRAETIKAVLEAELSFFGQVFGFTPAGDIETVAIENL